MHTAMHPAFEQKLAVLAALLERSKSARIEAQAKVGHPAPRFQASGKGGTWDVVEIATGRVHGFAYSYWTAIRFVNAMEAGATKRDSLHQPGLPRSVGGQDRLDTESKTVRPQD